MGRGGASGRGTCFKVLRGIDAPVSMLSCTKGIVFSVRYAERAVLQYRNTRFSMRWDCLCL